MSDQDSYNAAVRRIQELLDEKIAIREAVKGFCGGCGETDGDKRCLGCMHPFAKKGGG